MVRWSSVCMCPVCPTQLSRPTKLKSTCQTEKYIFVLPCCPLACSSFLPVPVSMNLLCIFFHLLHGHFVGYPLVTCQLPSPMLWHRHPFEMHTFIHLQCRTWVSLIFSFSAELKKSSMHSTGRQIYMSFFSSFFLWFPKM